MREPGDDTGVKLKRNQAITANFSRRVKSNGQICRPGCIAMSAAHQKAMHRTADSIGACGSVLRGRARSCAANIRKLKWLAAGGMCTEREAGDNSLQRQRVGHKQRVNTDREALAHAFL